MYATEIELIDVFNEQIDFDKVNILRFHYSIKVHIEYLNLENQKFILLCFIIV